MKKKIIISSIVAVVILFLVSFTGVVGYQTTSSTIAKASPLFKVRTNRAIGEEGKDLTCDYIGKGITLPFPERDDKAIMLQKVVDSIRRMDDKTLERFIVYIINHVRRDNRFNNVNPDKIREAFYQVKNSDKPIPILDANTEKEYHPMKLPSGFMPPTTCCDPWEITFGYGIKGFLGCLFLPFFFIGLILDRIFK